MRPRYLLAAAATTVALACLLQAPAGAAVTKKPSTATHVIPCEDGSSKVARVWFPTVYPKGYRGGSAKLSWAADNPCFRWLVMTFPGDSASDPYGAALSVAPGAHFQRSSQFFFADTEGREQFYMADAKLGTSACEMGWSYFEVRKNGGGKFRPIIGYCR
jgi:hypothetical protein